MNTKILFYVPCIAAISSIAFLSTEIIANTKNLNDVQQSVITSSSNSITSQPSEETHNSESSQTSRTYINQHGVPIPDNTRTTDNDNNKVPDQKTKNHTNQHGVPVPDGIK